MIRVLIADDQTLVRAGFRMIIDEQPDMQVVGEADTGARAVSLTERLEPDLLLMDIRMPVMDGIEATRQITTTHTAHSPRIVMLTTYDLDEYLFDALAAGASGFLLKDVPPEHLVHAVRVTAIGDALLAPSQTRRLIEQFASTRPLTGGREVLAGLTERERHVLRLLGRGKSNAEIAELLHLGESTVKTHVGHILDKLQLRDRVQAAILAYETGLIRPGHPDPVER
jgi:DNA-binding NarL/FixJ family response regulator